MRPPVQVVTRILCGATCAAAVMAAGCVAERYRPASTTTMDAASENPCEELAEIREVTPFYPADAIKNGEEGWVKLKYHVAANGEVFNVRVVASNPEGVFDDNSAAALARWKYPALRYPLQNCSHIDVYRFEGSPFALYRQPVVLSPRDQAEFAEFTTEEAPAKSASRR